jgi:chlorobactene glucosyltransferase
MIVIPVAVTLILIGMAGIAIVNTLLFPRLGQAGHPDTQPKVSILIPARNEAAVIGRTLRSLLVQSYRNFEIIVLDDQSTDDTAETVHGLAEDSARVRLIKGRPLPVGWLGKNWACQQLADTAEGEWLVFSDADVTWRPDALAALVAEMSRTRADLLAIWPTQRTDTWAERLTVPLMALVVLGYLPRPLVHHTPWRAFAAVNGQCLAFRRRAYETVGGHYVVQGEVLEDVILARHLKAEGSRLRMADGADQINCRMYSNWPTVRDGYAKNILAGYGGRISFLLLATLFHWLVFLLPWVWLAFGGLLPGQPGWPIWPLALVGLGIGIRALTAAATRQRIIDALLMPVSVLLMTRIALQAIWWQWRYGGPLWKGRIINQTHAPV